MTRTAPPSGPAGGPGTVPDGSAGGPGTVPDGSAGGPRVVPGGPAEGPGSVPAAPLARVPGNPAGRRRSRLDGAGTHRTLISAADLNRGHARSLYFGVLALTTVLFSLAFLFPLYWMVTGAGKAPAELARPTPTLIPESFDLGTYAEAWSQLQIAHYFLNTALYALGGWLIQLVVDVAVAYALSKLRPVLGNVVLAGMLASLMLPASALLVPAYLTVSDVPLVHVNLIDTPWALWLPAAANAFNIYVLKRFFDQIPDDLLDAAEIDGAGRLRVLVSVVLPLSRPVLGVVSIFAIIGIWKDFLWPLLVLQDTQVQTLSVALSRLSSTSQVPLNLMLAGLVIASIPMIVVFLLFQRSIIGGLSAGATKG